MIHKWTYDDIDIEFDEMFYRDRKNGRFIKLDLKFEDYKEGSFTNDYNSEVEITLTNENNKLCIYFRIDDIGYHNKPTPNEFKGYVEDFKATLLGVYDYIYELKKFEDYYNNNIGEVVEEQYKLDELDEIELEDEFYYDIDDSDSDE
jgi:hypothetical protein